MTSLIDFNKVLLIISTCGTITLLKISYNIAKNMKG